MGYPKNGSLEMSDIRTTFDSDMLDMQVWDYTGLPTNHTKSFTVGCLLGVCDASDFPSTTNNLCHVSPNCPTRYESLLSHVHRRRRSPGIINYNYITWSIIIYIRSIKVNWMG